jgi:hypothetical protein
MRIGIIRELNRCHEMLLVRSWNGAAHARFHFLRAMHDWNRDDESGSVLLRPVRRGSVQLEQRIVRV